MEGTCSTVVSSVSVWPYLDRLAVVSLKWMKPSAGMGANTTGLSGINPGKSTSQRCALPSR